MGVIGVFSTVAAFLLPRVAAFIVKTDFRLLCLSGNKRKHIPFPNQQRNLRLICLSRDDWSSFQALDDAEEKASFVAGGPALPAPEIERPAEPIVVPAGSCLGLSEETVLGVLSACRFELATLFGYTAENRAVAITGAVELVDLEGPTVIIRLKGRFWHQRHTVLERVANYLQQRIPEIVEVAVEDPWQLTDEANDILY